MPSAIGIACACAGRDRHRVRLCRAQRAMGSRRIPPPQLRPRVTRLMLDLALGFGRTRTHRPRTPSGEERAIDSGREDVTDAHCSERAYPADNGTDECLIAATSSWPAAQPVAATTSGRSLQSVDGRCGGSPVPGPSAKAPSWRAPHQRPSPHPPATRRPWPASTTRRPPATLARRPRPPAHDPPISSLEPTRVNTSRPRRRPTREYARARPRSGFQLEPRRSDIMDVIQRGHQTRSRGQRLTLLSATTAPRTPRTTTPAGSPTPCRPRRTRPERQTQQQRVTDRDSYRADAPTADGVTPGSGTTRNGAANNRV